MSKKSDEEVGALHSVLKFELHTFYAINTWNGRKRSDTKKAIIGMPHFLRLLSNITKDSKQDNPYADMVLLHLESLIEEGSIKIQSILDGLERLTTEKLPATLFLSNAASERPVSMNAYSHTQLGYRCIYLLVGFDQLVLKLFQTHHYGLISSTHRDKGLQKGGYLIRRIFTAAQRYKSLSVSRKDIVFDNCNAKKAIELLGEVDASVLLGEKRSIYSPKLDSNTLTFLFNGKR